jgi:FAD/FMN-containing dehydrogenase
MVNVAAFYESPETMPARLAWVEELAGALERGEPRAYVNFLNDDAAARAGAAYPQPTWDRLVEVKRRYDPDNVFRLNVNVPPDGVPGAVPPETRPGAVSAPRRRR